jgi:hypothetical protein
MAGKNNRSNGKGDQPRKVNGPKYRDNFDAIKWGDLDYPEWICNDCGRAHGKRPEGNPYGATYHMGKCGICGEEREVTEPRDWGHLREGWGNIKYF